jgi:hypothetical protein
MVQDTGKTLYVGTFKSLNLPELLYVEEDQREKAEDPCYRRYLAFG